MSCFKKGQTPKTKWYFHVFIILSVAWDGTEGQNQGGLLEAPPYQGFGLHSLPRLHFPVRIC